MPTKQEHVQRQENHEERRQHARVQREEPRECVMTVVAAADDQPLQRFADHGHERDHVRRDLRRPISFLVPRQQVTREREPEHELHQNEAEPEIDLARRAIRAVDHDLHEVDRHQHDHHLRREVVHAAQQPAGRHLVLDVVNAFPRRLRAGAVRRPQDQARHDLHEKAKAQRAAPYVPPPRTARNVLVQRGVGERPDTGAVIEPIEQATHPTGFLSAIPAWNF